jgi:hypothetical protein
MKEIVLALALTVSSIALAIIDPLRPTPKQSIPDPVLPFGPAQVSLARHASTMAQKLDFLGGRIILVDSLYICPTLDLLPSLLTTCEAMRTKGYVANAWDCDNIAAEFSLSAARWSVATYGRGCPAGIAMGEAYVHIYGPVEGLEDYPPCFHVINIACLADGQLIFIEPTSGRWVNVESAIYEGIIEVQFVRM